MTSTILYIIKAFILPPGALIILLLFGLIFWRHRRFAFVMVFITAILFYLLSLPIVTELISAPLQRCHALMQTDFVNTDAQAIVVLGAGRYVDAPEYHSDTASATDLVRLRYAAKLYKQTFLPILLSGGSVYNLREPEAQLMVDVLKDEYNVPVEWLESQSKDTKQEAKYCSDILRSANIRKIFLVTDAVHMVRAKLLFQKEGIEVIPAPTNFITLPDLTNFAMNFLPSAEAFYRSAYCLHEYVGVVWSLL